MTYQSPLILFCFILGTDTVHAVGSSGPHHFVLLEFSLRQQKTILRSHLGSVLRGVNIWLRYSYTSALQSTLDCQYSCFPPLGSLDVCGLHLNSSGLEEHLLKIPHRRFIFSQYVRLQVPLKQIKLH